MTTILYFTELCYVHWEIGGGFPSTVDMVVEMRKYVSVPWEVANRFYGFDRD